jgi:16S rRNA (guanine527-N7)-methyltransferase
VSVPALREQILVRAALAGVVPSAEQLEKLISYYALLERWNQKINLTALPLAARADSTVDRLIVEPLIAAPALEDGHMVWFDFGTGGGSPALPLKILRPKAALTMVEAKERKAAFLREAVSSLDLSDAKVVTARIEELDAAEASESVDAITVRAVRLDEGILGTSRNLLKLHGRVLVFRGEAALAATPGFSPEREQSLAPSSGFLSTLRKSG